MIVRTLVVQVADDGAGVAPTQSRHVGLGLVSMRERASELGGDCIITARPGGGTHVVARLPIPQVPTLDLT